MFNSEILEVAIGLIFVFLLTSLLASTVREMIEALLKTRAVQLEQGIRQLLDDPTGKSVTAELFNHPLLFSLFPGGYSPQKLLTSFVSPLSSYKHAAALPAGAPKPQRLKLFSNLPAYIPSRNFALALLDVVSGPESGVLDLQTVKANAMTLPPGRLKDAVLVALGEAQNDLDRARTSLEAWFDSNMDRVSGWYKRETQWILLALGLLLAVLLNIDALHVAHDLSTNNNLRQSLVAQAEKATPEIKDGRMADDKLSAQFADLSNIIGWPQFEDRMVAEGAAAPPPRTGVISKSPVSPAGSSAPPAGASPKTTAAAAGPTARAPAVPGAAAPANSAAPPKASPPALPTATPFTDAMDAVPGQNAAAKGDHTAAAARIAAAAKREKVRFTGVWWSGILSSLVGWLVTGLAVSLGAPFWFDLLNKFMVVRSTVKPFEKSPNEGSDDRRAATPSAERLAPQPLSGATTSSTSSPTSTDAWNGASASGVDTAPTVRLAIDLTGLDDGSLTLKDNGTDIAVPPSGFVELPLTVDVAHVLSAGAKRQGQAVAWTTTLWPTLQNEGQPLTAELA